MRGVGEKSLVKVRLTVVSEASLLVCSSSLCEAEQTLCLHKWIRNYRGWPLILEVLRWRRTWWVRSWGCRRFTPTHISIQNLQEKCPQIACVFCFHVATVRPPRLALVQLAPAAQTRPDCPVLETGRSFPSARARGLPSLDYWMRTSCLQNSRPHGFFLSGQEEK